MAGHPEDLKRAIRAARNKAGIKSDHELALQAGVHLQTIQNWMYGKTTPRPSQLAKVAEALDVSMFELSSIYEGRDPEPQPLQDSVRDLTAAVHELVAEIRADRNRLARRVEDSAQAFEDVVRLLRAQQPKDGGVAPPANGPAR